MKSANVVAMRARWFQGAAAWGAMAAVVVLVVGMIGWQRARETNALTAELLDQHLSTLGSGATPQVISMDKHTVKPWFQGRLPFSFNLPEPDALPEDVALLGGDLVYVEGQPTALLLYAIHKHEVSVFVAPRGGVLGVAPRTVRSGFAVRTAESAELRMVGVSDVNPAELEALMAVLAKVQ